MAKRSRKDTGKRHARSAVQFFSSAVDDRPDPLQDLMRDAGRQGFAVTEKTFPQDWFHASTGCFELTAFALAVLGPVYNDVYVWLKVQVPELWRTFFDADNPERIQAAVVIASGPVAQDWSIAFSVWADFRHGRVKLVFPKVCSEPIMIDTITKFAELMYAYVRGDTYDGIDLDSEEDCYYGTIIVAYAADEGKLQVVNPFEKLKSENFGNLRRPEQQKRARTLGTR